jgi:hypothetical protein
MALVIPNPAYEFHLTGGIIGVTNTNPFMSLGGQMATRILTDKMDNLFDPISTNQQSIGSTEYRWIVFLNTSTETIKSPHFYFSPKDPFIDIEFSRLALSAPVSILAREDDRPAEDEIGPEVDVPMPFTKSKEDYETTLSISTDILPGGKLYICIRREIPEDTPSESKAAVLIMESRVPIVTTSTSELSVSSAEGV